MSDKFDSKGWTGDYPQQAHYALASAAEKRRMMRAVVSVACGIALMIASGLVYEVLK